MSSPGIVSTGITQLRIRNYRVLRDITLEPLTPVTVLLGPNGSGKSTVLDALRFVQQAVTRGLAEPCDERGGIAEIRSRAATGPVEIELGCGVEGEEFSYRLVIDEDDGAPVVAEEQLLLHPPEGAEMAPLLRFHQGRGTIDSGDLRDHGSLIGPDVLAVGVFGQLGGSAGVAGFRRFMSQCRLSNLDIGQIRPGSRSRASRRVIRLSSSGDNLAKVVEHLRDARKDEWAAIISSLRAYVPGLEEVIPEPQGDGRYIVRIKEQGSDEPILPESISDGTLKLLGYLVALRDRASVLLIEEPENQVHPRLHYHLAEDIRISAESGQVIVATHSPQFVDALRPEEVWVLYRGEDGYANAARAVDLPRLVPMVESGGALGDLWTEGYFRVGDPLTERP
ncbi:MAG TPA: AAA family ATPase [Actinophytocola sp.]|jgi:predicted ATPase|uniref:AAA family ATPase n=1 Tax=Actinophytocola sp. TaxID=1872138 RepID=UPI002E05266F|nr:AAA family ATPase [Actinophytocola sp.]